MQYPNWAPDVLVNFHKLCAEKPESIHNPDEQIEHLKKKPECSHFTDEDWASVRRYLDRALPLSDQESKELLGRLLTDQRMKDVWKTLAKRQKSNEYCYNFWDACVTAIRGWRNSQKLTTKERQTFLAELGEHARDLRRMFFASDQFYFYQTGDLIDDKETDWLIDTLEIKPTEKMGLDSSDELRGYVHFMLGAVVPSVVDILSDIESKTVELLNEEVLVKKPNSKKAPIHYFVRRLSEYLRKGYGQPLHDVVAATASVVFDGQSIDSDQVRKLLKT